MSSAEDQRNHKRVEKAFGKASEYQCYLCFDRAAEWAHLWRTHPDKTDPESYIPLCVQDHRDYDYETRITGIKRFFAGDTSKYRENARKRANQRYADPDFKQRHEDAVWEAHQDPEYRKRISAAVKAAWARRKAK